jgi:ADP-ribose pyrophosphatase YjhB (NUDIX family)
LALRARHVARGARAGDRWGGAGVPGQAQLRERLAPARRGVEAGETLSEALARELQEEGNIEMTAPPQLHSVFFNSRDSRRDHVALFVVRAFRQFAAPVPGREIVGHGFFDPDALPGDTTAATRARIIEVLGGAPVSERW